VEQIRIRNEVFHLPVNGTADADAALPAPGCVVLLMKVLGLRSAARLAERQKKFPGRTELEGALVFVKTGLGNAAV
jgi:hypothetical protein